MCLAIPATVGLLTFANRDTIPELKDIQSENELLNIFKVRNQIERAVNAVNRTITFMDSAEKEFENSKDKKSDYQLAELWIVQGLIKLGNIRFDQIKGLTFREILYKSFENSLLTQSQKERLKRHLGRELANGEEKRFFEENHDSPLATLVYKSVRLFVEKQILSTLTSPAPESLTTTKAFFKGFARFWAHRNVDDPIAVLSGPLQKLFLLNHQHLPPISADNLSKAIQDLSDTDSPYLSIVGAKLIYALLVTTTAKETTSYCDNPTLCHQGSQEPRENISLNYWPKGDKSSAFGRWQFIRKTFSQYNGLQKRISGRDLTPTDPRDQQIAAILLLVNKLIEFSETEPIKRYFERANQGQAFHQIEVMADLYKNPPYANFRADLFKFLGKTWEPFSLDEGNGNSHAIYLTSIGLALAEVQFTTPRAE